MKNLSEWFFANKLSLNIKKSNYIIFTPRQRRQTLDLLLEINNHRLERVKETSFLGVILDESLTWKSHISYVASKISKSIGIIYRSSFCLTRLTLRTLYFALVYPYLLRISLICAFRIFFSLPNGVRRSTFDAGLVTKFGAFSSLNIPKLI